MLRIAWIGFHVEGLPALEGVLEGWPVAAVITLKPERAIRRSGAADYRALCDRYGVRLYEVDNINDEPAIELLTRLELDVVFVIGWTQIVRARALSLARIGMLGAHASLLPHNRGRAPVNWALIRGEARTGNTLMWLDESVDAGTIVDQTEIPISIYDTCASIYDQVAESNRAMILRLLPRVAAGERPGRAQTHTDEPLLLGRRPEDGLVDWSRPSREIYDFVRALTRPYPGAFSHLDGKRWRIWQSALLPPGASPARAPGHVIGPACSHVEAACGQVVACGDGAALLLELESDDGLILKGRSLSDQKWDGKAWTHGR